MVYKMNEDQVWDLNKSFFECNVSMHLRDDLSTPNVRFFNLFPSKGTHWSAGTFLNLNDVHP